MMSTQPWEPRVSRLEGAFEQIGGRLADLQITLDSRLRAFEKIIDERLGAMDKRLDAMEKRIDGLDKRIDGVEKRIDTLDSKIDNTTRWMVGLMLGSWITLMAAIFLHH
jgi:archaellum component FlaC